MNANIEKLYQQWRDAQPLNETLQRRIDQSFMIDFNYNSNNLEGNTLTYGQTKMLLLFGKVTGTALMRDLEEMKAHNVGLELMKIEALDRERPLSESFIRELNRTILAGDFYKVSSDGSYKYKIHTGIYKTRPNSVITPSGEVFDYASPEETPAMMGELVAWYNGAAQALHPIEQAVVFHYRYIRIHPFEDGNGRIARLLVNYILYRHGYPMVVIPTADRRKYLNALGECDSITGKEPYNGANATIEQIQPFLDFLKFYIERKLTFAKDLLEGKIGDILETDKKDTVPTNDLLNDPVKLGVKLGVNQITILKYILSNNHITTKELAQNIKISETAIYHNIKKLRNLGVLERVGSDKTGHWQVNL